MFLFNNCGGGATSFPGSLSSVVGRKTLVAADHVTTQNLGGKKICWAGGVAEFDCCCGKLCGFENLEQSLKKLPALLGSKSDFADDEGKLFLPSSKYRRLSFTKKFGSRMEQKISDGYHM